MSVRNVSGGDAAGKRGKVEGREGGRVADFAHSPSLSHSIFANGKLKRGKILGQGERRRTTGPSVRRGDGDGDVGVRERQDNVNHERPRPPQHSSKAAQMYNIHM